MNAHVLKFYLEAYKLKNVIRTGWKELEISSERLESVAEHVYGSLVLAMGLESEYPDLDMAKVFKIMIVRELKKVGLKEFTTRDHSHDENNFKEVLSELTKNLPNHEEFMNIVNECEKNESKEALFAFQVSKIESDIQAKIYDLEGHYDFDKAVEDAKYFGEELSSQIIPQMKNPSDGFILYDRQYYSDDKFKELSEEIQNLKTL